MTAPADVGFVRMPVPASAAVAEAEVHVAQLVVAVVITGVVAAASAAGAGANVAVVLEVDEMSATVDDVVAAELGEDARVGTDVLVLVLSIVVKIEVNACQKLGCLASRTILPCHSSSQKRHNRYEPVHFHHQLLHSLLYDLSFQLHQTPKHYLKCRFVLA